MSKSSRILIIGATGFVGKQLLKSLTKTSHKISVFVRTPSKLPFTDNIKVFEGDLLNKASLQEAISSNDIIYYLAHAMDQSDDFEKIELNQVENVTSFLSEKHTVIYLGGLGNKDSKHLRSRKTVGEVLRQSKALCIEFQASIIIGEGSLSFELIRAIVERFPVILATSWSQALCQPLAAENLISYLIQAPQIVKETSVIELGGPQVVKYSDLLRIYAKVKKLNRPVVKINSFSKQYVQLAMDQFLSDYSVVGKKLLESIEIETVKNSDKDKIFDIELFSIEEAMQCALSEEASKWEQLSIEELFNTNLKNDIKVDKLTDYFEIDLPLSSTILRSVIELAIKANKYNPFSKFKIDQFEFNDDLVTFSFSVNNQASLKSQMRVKEQASSVRLCIDVLYEPFGFFDASSYILFQNTVFQLRSFLSKLKKSRD